MGIILVDSISISQSAECVFDMITDINRVHEWESRVSSVIVLSRGHWGGHSQARLVMNLGNNKLKMVETVLEYERPTLFASKVQYIRFLPLLPKDIGHKKTPVNDNKQQSDFNSFLGKGEPYAIVQIDFTPTGNKTMTLRIATDIHVGGFSWFAFWCAKTLHLRPHKKTLKSI
ncbi:MAG: hypothetical protein COB39_08540 [Marinosulfonomonas sp.]|nr:MAG: hypothetical protein COB39_08540 [Marinosulfonomonas sp.]